MKVYIAGPMRGIPQYNFPAFAAVARDLREQGHEAVSPAELDMAEGFRLSQLPNAWDWHQLPDGLDTDTLVDRDLAALKTCDAIYMLDGWERSTGARAELGVARWLGLGVMYQTDPEPSEAEQRKRMPVASGVLDYFPDAIRAIAACSWVGNEQHNPGEPLHWAREKSSDHADCLVRHFMERGTVDSDGVRHSTKAAWRALALLQLELEAAR